MNDSSGSRVERRLRREGHPDQLRWIAQARSLAAVFDVLRQPLVLLLPGDPIRIWHANSAARHQLSIDPDIRIRDGVLIASPGVLQSLQQAIAQAQRLGTGYPQPLTLPGRAATGAVQALDFGASTDLPVSSMVLLELRESATTEHGLLRLCGDYRLTRKEAEAALGLYAMGSVNSLARCMGRSVHTIRTQLKAAMQKTGTHTQAGLVAVVAHRLSA